MKFSFKRWRRIALTVLFSFLPLAFLSLGPAAQQSSLIPSENQDIESFIKVYWQRPIPLQGTPPTYFTEKEASLYPEARSFIEMTLKESGNALHLVFEKVIPIH